jgi:hypothetical protein
MVDTPSAKEQNRIKTEEQCRDVARLRSVGLYTDKQIARALMIDESAVSHIYYGLSRVPNNPVMTFEEVAKMEDVNCEVVASLAAGGHILVGYGLQNIGRNIHGNPITIGIRRSDARGIGQEWVSVVSAAQVAGMRRPRGMYNRVLKGQVVAVKACKGRAFHIGEQKGLKIIVKKASVEPAQQKSKRDPVQQDLSHIDQPKFTLVVNSDTSEKPIIITGRQLSVTVTISDPAAGSVHNVLEVDVDMLPGDRPQIRTRTYAQ